MLKRENRSLREASGASSHSRHPALGAVDLRLPLRCRYEAGQPTLGGVGEAAIFAPGNGGRAAALLNGGHAIEPHQAVADEQRQESR